jgi:hypothetical protein
LVAFCDSRITHRVKTDQVRPITLDKFLARSWHGKCSIMEQQAVQQKKSTRTRPGLELEPETILPTQFASNGSIDASLQAEKRLMLAVLEEAVGTYQKYVSSRDRNGMRLFEEADEWFLSDDIEWPFSFVNICHTLGLEVDYFRSGLAKWRGEQEETVRAGGRVIRFPFRRVNGTRHSITGKAPGLRKSA